MSEITEQVTTNQTNEAQQPEQQQPEPAAQRQTLDLKELLKTHPELRSQLDKHTTGALNTARAKWEQEQSLTAEQRAENALKERSAALDMRERELKRQERRASAVETLTSRGLPPSLVGCVSLEDDDQMAATLDAAEKAFRDSVKRSVNEQLKAEPPKQASPSAGQDYLARMRQTMGLK